MHLSVYSRAMLLIGASLSLITVVMTFRTIQDDHAVLIQELRNRLATQAEQQAAAVAGALWNLNRDSTRLILQGLTRDPDFVSVIVVDEVGRTFAQVGADDFSGRPVERNAASIVFGENGQKKVLGFLSLTFSLEGAQNAQRQAAWKALVLGLVQLVAVLAATALALRAVIKPIERITGRMLAIAQGHLDQQIPYQERRDQIGETARAVETFRGEILERRRVEAALRYARDDLERRVSERTRELSESEERLRGVMESVADGIITINGKGTIESANRSSERIFGYPIEELVGQNVRVLMPEPHRSRHDQYIADYIQTGNGKILGVGPREVMGRHKSGAAIPLEIAISEMRPGQERKFVGVARDISERKEAERRLQQSQKMETVGQLTGGIAHDFNNMLVVILGNLELLAEDVASDQLLRDRIALAAGAAERGAELTRRLLAFSRRQPLMTQILDVNRIVSDMQKLLRQSLGETFEIRTVLADRLWQTNIDPHQLENCLLNLAVNARDAMPNGGSLIIETANVDLDKRFVAGRSNVDVGEYVMLAVSDTGMGMPPEVADKAFEPFFTTKEPGKGTGLGLSMVYGFAKQSNGYVDIVSEIGRGTTVTLYFPRTTATQSRGSANSGGDGLPTGTETILVVEDDSAVRKVVVNLLERLGYRIIQADNGAAALTSLDAYPEIDLLFTDVVMPGGMSGIELGKIVRRRLPSVKILYTSGYPKDAAERAGTWDDGDSLISKPYQRAALARKVRSILDN